MGMKDLIVVVADKAMQFTLRGALSRPQALGIRPISFEFLVHPYRDGGVRTTGVQLLSLERQQYSHGLLVLDFDGSGAVESEGVILERNLDMLLEPVWTQTGKAIVIEPELDVWMWGSDNVLHTILGRPGGTDIREWLSQHGIHFSDAGKPVGPKEAMEMLLKELRRPRSASIYEKIARTISLKACTDPAFLRLRATLQLWFPME